ncbi:hypothetical protein SEA_SETTECANDELA_187 [Mycobacterium phage Settecandela]|nr:hypothetical protein SEA_SETTECANDELA_187 [Mycobacterium phage Settecandela]
MIKTGPANDPSLGMRLSDVRRFVEETAHLSPDAFIDCQVPAEQEGKTVPSALMALEAEELLP